MPFKWTRDDSPRLLCGDPRQRAKDGRATPPTECAHATTGRDDGENCQVGFIDTCDTPYRETIEACREVGYGMYQHRLRGTR